MPQSATQQKPGYEVSAAGGAAQDLAEVLHFYREVDWPGVRDQCFMSPQAAAVQGFVRKMDEIAGRHGIER